MSVRLGMASAVSRVRAPHRVHQVDEPLEEIAARRAGPARPRGDTAPRTAAARRAPALRRSGRSGSRASAPRCPAASRRRRRSRGSATVISTLPRRQVHHRLVAAVMAELELVGSPAQRQTEIWCPRQMPKIGFLPIRSRTISRRTGTASGSPGPLERKMPSGFMASTSAAGVVAGTTRTRQPAVDEIAQDVALDAEVVGDDEGVRRRRLADGPPAKPAPRAHVPSSHSYGAAQVTSSPGRGRPGSGAPAPCATRLAAIEVQRRQHRLLRAVRRGCAAPARACRCPGCRECRARAGSHRGSAGPASCSAAPSTP